MEAKIDYNNLKNEMVRKYLEHVYTLVDRSNKEITAMKALNNASLTFDGEVIY